MDSFINKRLCLSYMLLLLLPCLFLSGNDSVLVRNEVSLKGMFESLSINKPAASNLETNEKIISLLDNTLRNPGSFEYPFSSLSTLGSITSSDSLIRIFTWNVQISPVKHNYYGFLQVRTEESDEICLYFLNQTSTSGEEIENLVLGPENWYGALYYQLHTGVYKGETYYTIIGLDFNDVFTNIKVVDILTIAEGIPVFGHPLFRFPDGMKHRAVFEYSSRVVMFLRYVPEADMIIYDHLSPESPGYKGQYRYYGPDFSYDAFKFENGMWNYISDVDFRR